MGHTISDGEESMISKDSIGSPQIDDVHCGGHESGGVVLKKGPWTSAEDAILVEYVKKHGEGNWNAVQKHSGLSRCGKSCRLRWANHLRPNLKKGAFTPEEERLIIELHAKMGNKWARMAAHLPGRTDNEIKNYWNTRIKRRQRAGLPIYPPEVCLQACQENQQSQTASGSYNVDNQHHDLLQNPSYDVPDVVFDSLKVNQGFLPYIPELSDISSTGMLMKGLGSHLYSFLPSSIPRPKRLRESMNPLPMYCDSVGNETASYDQSLVICENKSSMPFDCPFSYEPDLVTKTILPFESNNSGSHSILNDNFSASKPTSGAMKLELPSLQTNIGGLGSSPPPLSLESMDVFIQSPPPTGMLQSDSLSPRNSGLLDALVHEAKILSSGKTQLSDKSSNSSTITPGDIADSSADLCPTEWDDFGEPISPLGNSQASIFSECTPTPISGGSSLEDNLPLNTFSANKVKPEPVDPTWIFNAEEKETFSHLRNCRPDAVLGSCWIDQSYSFPKKQHTTDAIAALLGVDLGSDTRSMTASQKLGFGSCMWNNMPPVRQMSDQR